MQFLFHVAQSLRAMADGVFTVAQMQLLSIM
jgi:hypothetical protein